jgi:hypothetical protein
MIGSNAMKGKLKYLAVTFLVAILLLAGACASSSSPVPGPAPMPAPPEDYESGYYDKGYNSEETDLDDITERKVVRTGYMTLEVDNVGDALADISKVARDMDGYVVSSRKYENDNVRGSISIRVPSDRFEDALEQLRHLAIAVPDERTSSVDVTEEYIDLEARLHNLEVTEAQYQELMDQAETVEEILKVQDALSRVRTEIERIEGRLQYLERTTSMSLIEVSLQESQPLVGPWSPASVIESAAHGLVTFGRGLFVVVVWLGVFCWIWIPLLVIWRKRRKKKKNEI